MHCVKKCNTGEQQRWSQQAARAQHWCWDNFHPWWTPGKGQARQQAGTQLVGHQSEQVPHLQGTLVGKGHQWDGLPQNISCLLICFSLHNQSVGCTGGELKNRKLIDEDAVDTPRWIRMPRNVLMFDSHHDGSGGSTETAGQTKEEFASSSTASSSLST